ncbi:hypothetical protein SDC9_158605 [bioreactor metagenome]|uniref:Uncharacterized protein n=1 Tax=bioreactor metagenome TaxID=1076179 RepID=A0A645FFM9_9ZZZZ
MRSIGVRHQLASALRFGEAACKARLPVFEGASESKPETLWKRAHLLPQIADQATTTEFVPCHALLRIDNERAQAIERRQCPVTQVTIQFAGEEHAITLDQREAVGLLAIEVVIEGTLRHPDTAKDLFYPGRGETLFGQRFHPRAQQQFAGVSMIFAQLGWPATTTRNGV